LKIGERLRHLRKENNLTLEEVGKKINVSKQTLQRYESGVIGNIPSDKIELLASIYNTSPAYIMGWDEEKKTSGIIDEDIEIKLLAAHKEGDNWTDEELETIEMVKEMLRQKRKKKLEE